MPKTSTPSAEVTAIVNTLKAHRGEKLSWTQVCELAGVKANNGYVASVKKALGSDLTVGEKDLEVVRTVKSKVNSYCYNPADGETDAQ